MTDAGHRWLLSRVISTNRGSPVLLIRQSECREAIPGVRTLMGALDVVPSCHRFGVAELGGRDTDIGLSAIGVFGQMRADGLARRMGVLGYPCDSDAVECPL